jgi:hypothetical protein
MIRNILCLSTFLLFFSCDTLDQDVIPIVGVYESHVQGLAGPFSMSVSADRGDNILIEAPFDGFEWIVIEADVDNQQEDFKEIKIFDQEVGNGVFIEGEGFFFDGTMQLDYSIDFGNDRLDFRLIGSKF